MKNVWKRMIICSVFVFVTGILCQAVQAESLKDAVATVLQNNEKIKIAEAKKEAAKERIRVAYGKWFPKFNLNGSVGKDRWENVGNTPDNTLTDSELDLKINQLIWDFGDVSASIQESKLLYMRADASLEMERQKLILEALTAYFNLKKSESVLAYAQKSEGNIKTQTELESERIKKGMGYSSDVLQAKSQLLGAKARRVQAEGEIKIAANKAVQVFKRPAVEVSALDSVKMPLDLIPATIEDVENNATAANPNMAVLEFNVKASEARIDSKRAQSFFPVISGEAGSKMKDNIDGTEGYRDQTYAELKLDYTLNLGAADLNALKALKQDYLSSVKERENKKSEIAEYAKNAFNKLKHSIERTDILRNQADISREFLTLARKEHQLGRRSLLDVLNGETALINAESDAAAAESGIGISAFTVLESMGILTFDKLEAAPAPAPKPEPIKEAVVTPDVDMQSIDKFVDFWAKAWSTKNYKDYVSCYSDQFIPAKGVTLAQWGKDRQKMLATPNVIELGIDMGKKEIISPNNVQVTFKQTYKSNLYKDITMKTLDLLLKDKAWKIVKEDAKPVKK